MGECAYIVTQSLKKLKEEEKKRAQKMLDSGNTKKSRKNPNDPALFIGKMTVTKEGEVTDIQHYLDENKISEEAQYDGLYAVCTDLLDDEVSGILKVSEGRWQIEEYFRIMKTDFSARPVYLQDENRIKAHLCYVGITLLATLTLGTACSLIVCRVFDKIGMFGKLTWHFPALEVLLFAAALFLVQAVFSVCAVRYTRRFSFVERIKAIWTDFYSNEIAVLRTNEGNSYAFHGSQKAFHSNKIVFIFWADYNKVSAYTMTRRWRIDSYCNL